MHDPNGSGKPLPEPVALVFGQAEATSAGQLNTEAFRQQFGPAAFDEATNSAGVAVMRKPTIGQSGKAQVFAAVVAAMSSVLMTTKFRSYEQEGGRAQSIHERVGKPCEQSGRQKEEKGRRSII